MSTEVINTGESFRSPGDIKIDRLSLHSKVGEEGVNLIPFLLEIDLYEDIFSPTMSATMVISDSIGLSSGFPIIGGESIQIDIQTPEIGENGYIRKRFIIYKVEAKLVLSMKSVYVLHLISEYAYKDNMVRLSRKLSGNIIPVIKNILVNDLNVNFDVLPFNYASYEENINNVTFLSPNWSPITTINKMVSMCTDPTTSVTDGELASYLFFEGNKGLNFWSLSSLTVQSEGQTPKEIGNEYFYDANSNRKKGIRDFSAEMHQIHELRIDKQFDMIDRMVTGLYVNHVAEFDILRKRVSTTPPFDYMKSIESKMWKLNKYPLSRTGTDFGDGKFSSFVSFNQSLSSIDKSVNAAKNRISLALMNSVNIEIKIHGRTDIEVGDQLYLNIPNSVNSGDNSGISPVDELISGNYVITAIQHRINEFKHSMIVRLSTDSYSIKV